MKGHLLFSQLLFVCAIFNGYLNILAYDVTLSWDRLKGEGWYPQIDDDYYSVTENETVKDLIDKFKKKALIDTDTYSVELRFGDHILQSNDRVKDALEKKNYNAKSNSVKVDIKKQTPPTSKPEMITTKDQQRVTIELPGGAQQVIEYDQNDTYEDIIRKLRQKTGVGEKYEITLFEQKLNPKARVRPFKPSDKIYAMDIKK
jgi:hypothetical protein